MAQELGLDKLIIAQGVEALIRLGMAEWKGKRLSPLNPQLHLSKSSSYFGAWRNQLRMQCLHRLHSAALEDDYSFSVTISADPATKQWLQREFLALLSRAETQVRNAKAESVYQMNFDLFSWTRG